MVGTRHSRDWRSPWWARATHHHHTFEPGGAPRDWRSPWWARATLHHHTFEPGGAPRDEGPHGGRVPLSTRSTLSGVPHEGHWWFALVCVMLVRRLFTHGLR